MGGERIRVECRRVCKAGWKEVKQKKEMRIVAYGWVIMGFEGKRGSLNMRYKVIRLLP